MRSFRWCAVWLVAFGTALGSARADVGLRLNTYISYTDNLFQNHSRRSDLVTLAYFDVDYWLTPGVNLYYSGSANVFSEYQDLFTHTHHIGAGYAKAGRGRNAYYAGVQGSLRLDRPLYRYYDYTQGSGYVNAKVYLAPQVLSRAGYEVRYRNYVNASDYRFAEQVAYVQLNRFLPTRTTLQAQVNFGLKSYVTAAVTDTTGLGIRMGGARHLSQARFKAKVAQALASRTGLQVEYVRRINVSGRDRYARLDAYNTDDELFDDKYSHEGRELTMRLKHTGPFGVQLTVVGNHVRRDYEGRPALDLDGVPVDTEPTRSDLRRSVSLEAASRIYLGKGWVDGVNLTLEYRYLDVESNDPYYDTSATTVSIGLQVAF